MSVFFQDHHLNLIVLIMCIEISNPMFYWLQYLEELILQLVSWEKTQLYRYLGNYSQLYGGKYCNFNYPKTQTEAFLLARSQPEKIPNSTQTRKKCKPFRFYFYKIVHMYLHFLSRRKPFGDFQFLLSSFFVVVHVMTSIFAGLRNFTQQTQ